MENERFISIHKLSRELGLPTAWLRGEATANRIPSLLVGRRMMFSAQMVRRALIERTEKSGLEKVNV